MLPFQKSAASAPVLVLPTASRSPADRHDTPNSPAPAERRRTSPKIGVRRLTAAAPGSITVADIHPEAWSPRRIRASRAVLER